MWNRIAITVSMSLWLAMAACAAEPASESVAVRHAVDYDGLAEVDARRFDAAFLRPGVDVGRYGKVLISPPELAFRTPDRSERQFPLSPEQKARFETILSSSLAEQLAKSDAFELTESAGPDVLHVRVRVQDITATIPPRGAGTGGRSSLALAAIGEAVLVVEIEDSESREILGRAVDSRVSEGVAIMTADGPLTRWEDLERVCARWASNIRRGLETLVEAQ